MSITFHFTHHYGPFFGLFWSIFSVCYTLHHHHHCHYYNTCRKSEIKKENLKKLYFSKVDMLHGDLWLLLHGLGVTLESNCWSTCVFKLVLFQLLQTAAKNPTSEECHG